MPVTSEGPIAALRVLRGGPGLIVSRGHEVVLWIPERAEEAVLARHEGDDRELLGADVCGGGVVMWLGTPYAVEKRKR